MHHRSAAVAGERVTGRKAALPTRILPALEGGSQNPASLLANGLSEPAGKILTHGYTLGDCFRRQRAALGIPPCDLAAHRVVDESGLETRRRQLKPHHVILGEASLLKGISLVPRGEKIQRLARESSADSRRGHHTPDRFAGIHILRVKLGKFVEIGISHPVDPRRQLEGKDRQLAHVQLIGHIVVVNFERERMQDVLGIVQRDDAVFATAWNLTGGHRTVDPIQAIGFRGGTIMRHHRLVNPR